MLSQHLPAWSLQLPTQHFPLQIEHRETLFFSELSVGGAADNILWPCNSPHGRTEGSSDLPGSVCLPAQAERSSGQKYKYILLLFREDNKSLPLSMLVGSENSGKWLLICV